MGRAVNRHPAVTHFGDSSQYGIGAAAKPDGNRSLPGQGVQSCIGNRVPLTLKGNQRLRPQAAQQRHLFFLASAPRMKILVERYILDGIPAAADAAAQTAVYEHVERRRLPR